MCIRDSRWAAAGIEHPLLQGGGIGQAADHPAKGIDFMHQLAFGRPAHGWVAGLPGDAIEVEAEQGRRDAQPSGRECCFAAGMTTAYNDQLK